MNNQARFSQKTQIYRPAMIVIVLAGILWLGHSLAMELTAAAGQTANGVGLQSDLARATMLKEQESARLSRQAESENHFVEIGRKVRITGLLPVIVQLRVSPLPEIEQGSSIAIKAQQVVIRRVRERVMSEIVGYDPASVKDFEYIPFIAVKVNEAGVESLRATAEVLDIQEDYLHRPSLAQSTVLIGANNAWASGYTGSGQTVAILDTGVDKTHPFLAGKVVAEACFSTASNGSTSVCPGGAASSTAVNSGIPCGVPGDCNHGTHVAGIVAGKGTSFSGVARDANLIAVQVFSRFDSTADCDGSAPCVMSYTSDIIRGLQRVYELRSTFQIAAANLSLGGGEYKSLCDSKDAATKAAVDLLRSGGIATTAASGNESFTDALSSPACISTVISVGSVSDVSSEVSTFSNSASFLSLLAPGGLISSSIPGGGFETWSGTSMASPHVAGAWAILKQRTPTASVAQVLDALITTGLQVTDSRNKVVRPLIKVDSALTAIGNPGPPTQVPAAPTGLTAIVTSTSRINLSWLDNSADELGFKVYRQETGETAWTLLATLSPNTLTYSNSGLPAGTTFNYQVTAFNSAGESLPSNESKAATLAPPATPTGLVANVESGTRINLIWTDSSGNETGFRIRRRTTTRGSWTVIGTVGPNTTSYINSGLNPGQTYYYVVTAFSSVAESPFSNQASATTVSTVPPAAPTTLTAIATSATQVDLAWQDNSGDETGFRISRKTGTNGSWAAVGTVPAGTTSIRNSALTPATTYFFRVTAYNSVGDSAASNEVVVVTPDVVPVAPSALTAVPLTTQQINLAWRDNSTNESGFWVERRLEGVASWQEVGRVGANVTSYQSTGLNPATSYLYRVTAWNGVGTSPPSNEAKAATPAQIAGAPPSAPAGLQATASSTTQVSLAWVDTSSNETGFLVQIRSSDTDSWLTTATVPAGVTNFLLNSGLVAGKTYVFRVKAVNGSVESSATSEVTVTLPTNNFTAISRGQSLSGRVARGESLYFKQFVPPGVTQLVFQTSGSGDIDLYVRLGNQPTRLAYSCRSIASNSSERCTIPTPATGDWHVLIYGYGLSTNLFSLTSNFQGDSVSRVQTVGMVPSGETDDEKTRERLRGRVFPR